MRIPASYCGLFGIRPSSGPSASPVPARSRPSFDTCGWFSRTASLLAGVGEVLLPGGRAAVDGPLLRVEEAWVNAQPDVAEALRPAAREARAAARPGVGIRLAPEGIDSFYDHFRTVQAEEVWASLGDWVEAAKPRFGPGVGERFAAAKATEPARGRARPRLPAHVPGARPSAAGGRRGAGLSDQPLPGPAADREPRPSRTRSVRQPSG